MQDADTAFQNETRQPPAAASRYWQAVADADRAHDRHQQEQNERAQKVREIGEQFADEAGAIEWVEGAGVVKVSRPDATQRSENSGGGKRGAITGMSKAAGRRLQLELASVRNDKLPLFATLTWPDVGWWSGPVVKKAVKNFAQRWKDHSMRSALHWKLEFKRRKMGTHAVGHVRYDTVERRHRTAEFEKECGMETVDTDTGEVVAERGVVAYRGEHGMEMPHLHLFIWPDSTTDEWDETTVEYIREWLAYHWNDVLKRLLDPCETYEDPNKMDDIPLQDWHEGGRPDLNAKMDEPEKGDWLTGSRPELYDEYHPDHDPERDARGVWGDHYEASTNVERIRSVRGVRSYAAKYFAKAEGVSNEWFGVGRFWGRAWKARIPYGTRHCIPVLHADACKMMRAIMRSEEQDYSGLPTARAHLCNDTAPWAEWAARAKEHMRKHAPETLLGVEYMQAGHFLPTDMDYPALHQTPMRHARA